MRLFKPRKTSAPIADSVVEDDAALFRRKSSAQELTTQAILTSSQPAASSSPSPNTRSRSSSRTGSRKGSSSDIVLEEAHGGDLWFVHELPSLSGSDSGSVIRVGAFSQPKSVYQSKAATADSMADQSDVFRAATSIACGESFVAYVHTKIPGKKQEQEGQKLQNQQSVGLLIPSGADHGDSLLQLPDTDDVKGFCAGPTHIVAWTEKAVYKWGDSSSSSMSTIDERVIQGSSGRYGTLLVTETGKVLSLGPLKPLSTPELIRHVACGGRHAVFIAQSGVVLGIGSNDKNQLGTGQSVFEKPSLLPLELHEPVWAAAAGEDHTVLLLLSGSVATLGSNTFGQLGVSSSLLPMQSGLFFPMLPRASSVSCGSFRSACICDGNAYVWGRLASPNMLEHCFAPRLLSVEDCQKVSQIAVGSSHFALLMHSKLNNQIRFASESIMDSSGGPPVGVAPLALSPRSLFHVQNGALQRSSKLRISCSEISYVFDLASLAVVRRMSPALQLYGIEHGSSVRIAKADPSSAFWTTFSLVGEGDTITIKGNAVCRIEVELSPKNMSCGSVLSAGVEIFVTAGKGNTVWRLLIMLLIVPRFEIEPGPIADRFDILLSSPSCVRHRMADLLRDTLLSDAKFLVQFLTVSISRFASEKRRVAIEGAAAIASGSTSLMGAVFDGLLRKEAAALLRGSDARNTAFRSESPSTIFFRGINVTDASCFYVKRCTEDMMAVADVATAQELLKSMLRFAPPSSLTVCLRALKACLEENEFEEDRVRQILLFFLFTRFICPLVLSSGDESKSSLFMRLSRDVGGMVNSSAEADIDLLQMVLDFTLSASIDSGNQAAIELSLVDAMLGINNQKGPRKAVANRVATLLSMLTEVNAKEFANVQHQLALSEFIMIWKAM